MPIILKRELIHRALRQIGRALAVAAVGVAALVGVADEWVDKANEPFRSIKPELRSDTIILPLLAKLTDAPGQFAKPAMAALIPASSDSFKAAAEWAQQDPQKAVLEGLTKVTTDDTKIDWRKGFAFGQPYGAQDVDPDMYNLGMYTELGEPPTLAGAKILYLPTFTRLESLAHVEATRLAAEGKVVEALEVLVRFTHFARQIADRLFYAEQAWAYDAMIRSVERLRDVVYVSVRSPSQTPTTTPLTPDILRTVLRRLKDRNGLIGVDRLKLPEAERFAMRQIVSRIFEPEGGPNADFSRTLARLGALKHPLRLFSEMAKWDAVSAAHADERRTRLFTDNVYNDWATRWELSPFDAKLKLQGDYQKMDKVRYAALDAMMGDISTLFPQRWRLQGELVGTRMGLAHAAYVLAQKVNAIDYTSIRTRILVDPAQGDSLDIDPFSSQKANLGFFVPMRDTKVQGVLPVKRYTIRVFVPGGEVSFDKLLGDDGFVLYGRGPDGDDTRVGRATQMINDEKGDFLMWPPVISLHREWLDAQGRLP